MSKVIRLNDSMLEKISTFISNDKRIDEMLHKSLLPEEPYVYVTGDLYGDDEISWLNYIVLYAIACQKRTLGE